MTTAIEFRAVDILFGKSGPKDRAIQRALARLDAGADRATIAADTGVVLGVAGASLTVRSGEISVLMGLSGSGKSTLLRSANGLNRVTRGHVFVRHLGEMTDIAACDSARLREVRRASIAMVFQSFALLPWRSVRDNVGLGLEFQGIAPVERRRIVDEKLELVGLSDWADRKTQELSGGMQQRVGLARAFATDADILLMDEPFSALDPLIRSRLQDELLSLQARVHKTILFVSHDLDEAIKLGDQITLMEGGRIVQTGSAEDIVLRPATPYVADFVQHMNPLQVLSGSTVLKRVDELRVEGGIGWRDSGVDYMVRLGPGDTVLDAQAGGQPTPIVPLAHALAQDLTVASVETSIGELISTVHRTGRPVLLTDGARLIGVCGATELLAALANK